MTKEEILEKFKSWCEKQGNDYDAALQYVMGDDTKFPLITDNSGKCTAYDSDIKYELNKENAEFASRCLKACAALRYQNVILIQDDIKLLKWLGFKLGYILKSELKYFKAKDTFIGTRELMLQLIRSYADQAESVIDLNYFKSINDKNVVSFHLACWLAAEAVRLEKFSDTSLKNIMCILETYLNHGGAFDALVCIYSKSEFCAQMLRNKMPQCMPNIYMTHMSYREVKKIARYYGYEKEYRKYALEERLGYEALRDATVASSLGIDSDESELISCLEDITDIRYCYSALIDNVCGKLKSKDQDNRGVAVLRDIFYKLLLSAVDCIDNSVRKSDIDIEEIPEHIKEFYKDPEISDRSYEPDHYSKRSIDVFSKLSENCGIAASVIFSILKTAASEGRNPDVYVELFYEYVKASQPYNGTAIFKKIIHALENGMTHDEILKAVSELCKYPHSSDSYFRSAADLYVNTYQYKTAEFCIRIIKNYFSQKDNKINSCESDGLHSVTYLSKLLYQSAGYKKNDVLFALFSGTDKNQIKFAYEYMLEHPEEYTGYLNENLNSFDKSAQRLAKAIITKVQAQNNDMNDFISNEEVKKYVKTHYNKRHESKIKFIPESLFSNIRFSDLSQTAPPEIIKYIYMRYMEVNQICKVTECIKIGAMLNREDLCRCVDSIYEYWLDNDAPANQKMILIPEFCWGSDSNMLRLKNHIFEWNRVRKALAVFCLEAAALNGGKCALLMLSQVADKFPDNILGKTARSALNEAAKNQGLSKEQLSDRIIPSLGLDADGSAVADYGSRTFTVTLMPDFSLKINDDSKNKVIKSLPKPNAGDDADKAAAAKKLVSEMKKQLKSVCALQKKRLYFAFRNARTWGVSEWTEVFMDNPVMSVFAGNLVWGVYDKEKLVFSFRPADDGTFCDINDNEIKLTPDLRIALVHPSDLNKDEVRAWVEQFEDYEIKQPFVQITANVITVSEDDLDEHLNIKKYEGRTLTVGAVKGLDKYGMVRSEAGDSGYYYGYELYDYTADAGMFVGSDDFYFGQGSDEKVKVNAVNFYRKTYKNSQWVDKTISPLILSKRFVSCCLDMLEGILE